MEFTIPPCFRPSLRAGPAISKKIRVLSFSNLLFFIAYAAYPTVGVQLDRYGRVTSSSASAHLGLFWREKTSSTRKTPTRHSAGKMYQRSPSKPIAIIPHSFLPNRAPQQRWKYSHRARICKPLAKHNHPKPPYTLTSGPSILLS